MAVTELCQCGSSVTLEHGCNAAGRNNSYEKIAAIIRGNPDMTYGQLQAEYHWTLWTIKMAVKLNDIKRTRGRKTAA